MANRTPSLPIIDVAALRSKETESWRGVAEEIRTACTDTGFFYVSNHGIDPADVAETFDQSKRFFEQPIDRKMANDLSRSPASRGYEPVGGQQLDSDAAPDLKESFYIGVDRGPDDPLVVAETPNHGANQWPDGLSGWRAHMEGFFAEMTELASVLSRGLALSLELPPDYFVRFEDNPMSILRLLSYPPHPKGAAADQVGAGTHTDWGCLTILAQKDAEGLEVMNASGDWILAAPIPDTFVINIGDMMARWTNDRYRSTPHRVINNSGGQRYSIAFFHDINYHALVECIPTCQSPENPAKYEPILAGDHIAEMYRRTYGLDAAE